MNDLYHVMIGTKHGWVCVVDINSFVCYPTAGRSRGRAHSAVKQHSGVDVKNTQSAMLSPLIKARTQWDFNMINIVDILIKAMAYYFLLFNAFIWLFDNSTV